MKTRGKIEIPGGANELIPLLYPFHETYPKKILSKFRWFRNKSLGKRLKKLNETRCWLTVINRLGARGDTLITANVIRCIKNKYGNLRVNCITPHSELIENDPNIDSINNPETFYSFDSSYFELIVRNEKKENVVEHNLKRLHIKEFVYKSSFHLLASEINWAKSKLSELQKPLIAISTRSNDEIKNWSIEKWNSVIKEIKNDFTIIHLGDDKEPTFEHVIRYAGKCSMRNSAALLSQSKIFVGPDSLLMHVANGLDIKSVIIFGNARPVNCLGYSENINLAGSNSENCSWTHTMDQPEAHKKTNANMNEITTLEVLVSIESILTPKLTNKAEECIQPIKA